MKKNIKNIKILEILVCAGICVALGLGASLSLPATAEVAAAVAQLPSYNIDSKTVSVAGISSGGFMAVQLQIAFSQSLYGTAVFAGGPFHCASGQLPLALECMNGLGISVPSLIDYIDTNAKAGSIDPTANLANKPIYMFSGLDDLTVHRGTMDALEKLYENYLDKQMIVYDTGTAAGHGWISPQGPNSCATTAPPFINNCGNDPEEQFLTMFFGQLNSKSSTLSGQLVSFDQNPFASGGSARSIGMDDTGWLFVPAACARGQRCRLVIALHGCAQNQNSVGKQFVELAGLNEWADTNNIVVLYPQTVSSQGNPAACWDWWGYTGANYDLKGAPQMSAIMGMVAKVSAGASH
jgi:poly(3-hydroxybutyrate) depolymerase